MARKRSPKPTGAGRRPSARIDPHTLYKLRMENRTLRSMASARRKAAATRIVYRDAKPVKRRRVPRPWRYMSLGGGAGGAVRLARRGVRNLRRKRWRCAKWVKRR